MKRSLIVILLFCVIADISFGQDLYRRKRVEATAGLGTSQFFGDIGGYSKGENAAGFKDLSFLQTHVAANLSLKYRVVSNFNVRFSNMFGFFHATDERGSNEGRELEARISFYEPAVIGEYYFVNSKSEASWGFSKGRMGSSVGFFNTLNVYAFTGIGGLLYNVKGNEALVSKGMRDGGFTAVIPLGAGTNIVFPDFNLGLEIGGRYAFSDWLDGYTTQYSSSNDVYYFVTFTFTYKMKTTNGKMPDFLRGNRNRYGRRR